MCNCFFVYTLSSITPAPAPANICTVTAKWPMHRVGQEGPPKRGVEKREQKMSQGIHFKNHKDRRDCGLRDIWRKNFLVVVNAVPLESDWKKEQSKVKSHCDHPHYFHHEHHQLLFNHNLGDFENNDIPGEDASDDSMDEENNAGYLIIYHCHLHHNHHLHDYRDHHLCRRKSRRGGDGYF